ncbi:MAG: short-chain dehydrogenase/reductase [Clostridia bacterium]|jgi:NAD(P)-dependent dehydrogenase (short-subunit alcohol dehydrogenase family)|nr:short-chain dehydrogenase/reductase [Clostridia bacterium]
MAVGENLQKLFSLENKVIVLTGAAGGIGSVLAKGLAGVGGDIVLCDVAMDRLQQVEKEIINSGDKAKSFELDIMSIESIKAFVDVVIKEYGKIDVLINCAGINKREGFLDVDESTYDKLMGINLKGVFFLSQEVAKHMIKVKRGNIINMSSHNAVGMLGGCSVYGATKSALTALTRSMAVEWAQYGIRANAIAPGHIITPLTTVTWEHPERSQYLKERIAMERPGTPEEILGLTVMLASESSSYMSGMMYHIDGGCLAGGKPWPYDTQY